jgi:DNA-binding CsgD family transcriptional regulator
MADYQTSILALAEIAAAAGPARARANAFLEHLRRVVPFDGAWIAIGEAESTGYRSLASNDLDSSTLRHLEGPAMAHDVDLSGADRPGPPVSPNDLPVPIEHWQVWAEALLPAGYQDALALSLYGPDERHIGFLALLSTDRRMVSLRSRRLLTRLRPILAHAIDPLRTLTVAAGLVQGATAGVVIHIDGSTEPLPGLPGHHLLSDDGPSLRAASERIDVDRPYSSFLWPLGGSHAPDGHARITALASPDDVPARLAGVVLLSPNAATRGLTARELQLLGLLVDGLSNAAIARALVVTQRTVASHVEHILAKLEVPTRTLAAVTAERHGLYVPAVAIP